MKSIVLSVLVAILVTIPTPCVSQSTPLVIAWQAPSGPDGFNPNGTLYNSPTCAPSGMGVTQFDCFITAVLPNISGIGLVVPWGVIDSCAANLATNDAPCLPDSTCNASSSPRTDTCYNWKWVDKALDDYLTATIGASGSWGDGCAGDRPCKIVLIIWLTQDSGGTNLFGGTPNTPAYVFTQTYANSIGTGCGTSCPPQDVLICKAWQGTNTGGGGGWGGAAPVSDTCWAMGSGMNDYGLWNFNGAHKLQASAGCMSVTPGSGFANYSGYPVMYEKPILTAAEKFISALALHYSSACPNTNMYSCGGLAQL